MNEIATLARSRFLLVLLLRVGPVSGFQQESLSGSGLAPTGPDLHNWVRVDENSQPGIQTPELLSPQGLSEFESGVKDGCKKIASGAEARMAAKLKASQELVQRARGKFEAAAAIILRETSQRARQIEDQMQALSVATSHGVFNGKASVTPVGKCCCHGKDASNPGCTWHNASQLEGSLDKFQCPDVAPYEYMDLVKATAPKSSTGIVDARRIDELLGACARSPAWQERISGSQRLRPEAKISQAEKSKVKGNIANPEDAQLKAILEGAPHDEVLTDSLSDGLPEEEASDMLGGSEVRGPPADDPTVFGTLPPSAGIDPGKQKPNTLRDYHDGAKHGEEDDDNYENEGHLGEAASGSTQDEHELGSAEGDASLGPGYEAESGQDAPEDSTPDAQSDQFQDLADGGDAFDSSVPAPSMPEVGEDERSDPFSFEPDSPSPQAPGHENVDAALVDALLGAGLRDGLFDGESRNNTIDQIPGSGPGDDALSQFPSVLPTNSTSNVSMEAPSDPRAADPRKTIVVGVKLAFVPAAGNGSSSEWDPFASSLGQATAMLTPGASVLRPGRRSRESRDSD